MNPEDDPLLGNSISGLLGAAMGTVPPDSQAVPENWEPPTPEHIAVLLPQYRIERLIGRGGMGAVYKGRQITLNRPVAIKVLPAELARNTEFVARFHREAQLLASLSHQGIVTIFDFGQTAEGHLYFVMEFVDGTDLHRLIHKTKLDPEQALRLTIQICEAMQYAHDMGVIHRDIKPANVLVTRDGRAKLADFGLALKPAEHAVDVPEPPQPADFDPRDPMGITALRITKPGTAMGTPDYAAPEVYEGKADERSDIYALGIMLYEMLTGVPPKGFYPLPSTRAKVDARIDRVVVKALEPDPEARYQKASDLKLAVESATRPLPAKQPPPSEPVERKTSAQQQPQRPKPAARPPARSQALPAVPPRRKGSLFSKLVMTGLLILVGGAAYDSQHQWSQTKRLLALVTQRHGGLTLQQSQDLHRCIDQARSLCSQINDADLHADVEAMIVVALAKANEFADARKAAEAISIPATKWKALSNIAIAQCRLDFFDRAIETAKSISDSGKREQCLAAIVEEQLASGSTRQLAEAADLIVTPAGRATLKAVTAQAQFFAGDKTGALSSLEAARDLAVRSSEDEAKQSAVRKIATAFARAGEVAKANGAASLFHGDVKGDPRGNIAIAQAENDDVSGAVATAKSLPSAWARGWAFTGIARVLTEKGKVSEAFSMLSNAPYDDQRNQGAVRLYTVTENVNGAKSALGDIARDRHNPGEANQMRLDNVPGVAALIARLEGVAAAESWLESEKDARVRARSWAAMASAWFPPKPLLPTIPKTDLATINHFAGAGPKPAATTGIPITPATPASTTVTAVPDPVLGKWWWPGDHFTTFSADGSFTRTDGGSGAWFCETISSPRSYLLKWKGVNVDRLKLKDGISTLDGFIVNYRNSHITAYRVPDKPSPPPGDASATMEPGFVPLLDKWHSSDWRHCGPGSMTDDNGVFTTSTPPGVRDPWGMFWYTGRSYSDFIVRIDFAVDTPGTNSGVYFRMPTLGSGNPALFMGECYESEIQGEETGRIVGVKTGHERACPLSIHAWNEMEITAIGQEITVKVNGDVMSHFTGSRNRTGYIGLQNLGCCGSAYFRSVRIKDLAGS